MNVLIISAFPPDPAPEANHALHLAGHLAHAGLAVSVLCKTGSITAVHENIVVHPIIEEWSWSDLPRLVACLRRCRPDVVLLVYLGWIYDNRSMITFLPTVCRLVLPGVPCITQFEAVDESPPGRTLVMRAVRELLARRGVHRIFGTLLRDSARIIALSGPHRARLARHDPAVDEKSVILPPPPLIHACADDPAVVRRTVREAIGASPDDFVLVFFGYIYPGKGVDTLLKAFRIASRRTPHLRLVFVGGNLHDMTRAAQCREYFRMVEHLPERLGIADRVTWTGNFSWDSDLGSRYLHAGDACVLPFDYGVTLNNSSLAAATTHGLPVIATELGDGREEALEHGRNVYLVRPRDPEMLAEAIELVREATAVRERLREGSRALARDWHCWARLTDRLVGVMRSARAEGEAPGRDRRPSDSAGRAAARLERDRVVADVRSRERSAGEPGPAPLVSVVVAAHNVAAYLPQCLDSLVNQTLRNVEVIVVNDASTDETRRIIDGYRSRYPQVRPVDCPRNVGLASVRNIGLDTARGTYVAFVDGDDWADTRMCEGLYRRATADGADVVIADATVFYEESKSFGPFFDQHIRRSLHPDVRTLPFDLTDDARAILLEPVAWTKLYRRSFLEAHGLRFEDGMNSYEDVCFHFSVLLKATRITLIDEPLFFYRQNRPGQISARTDRRVFEVFDVFDKIQANLAAWNVPPEIWGHLVEVERRQFDWLLGARVRPHHRREFQAAVARQLAKIPEAGFRSFARHASRDHLTRVLLLRGDRVRAHLARARGRREDGGGSPAVRLIRRRVVSAARSVFATLVEVATVDPRVQGLRARLDYVRASLEQLNGSRALARQNEEPVVDVCEIWGQKLLLAHHPSKSGLWDAITRARDDRYLLQTAVFREGDVVVDVGAHVGVAAISLAKRYPFIRVYAIEPDPTNYRCLARNIELNEVRNIVALHCAVSGDGRERTLYSDPFDSGWATIDAKMAVSRRWLRTVEVQSITLEQLFGDHDIRHCRVLKMTARGAIRESLTTFTTTGCVDLLCGEAYLEDCGRPALEVASWRIARQHFWRTPGGPGTKTADSWIHQLPTEYEGTPPDGSPHVALRNVATRDAVAPVEVAAFGSVPAAHARANGGGRAVESER